jgi:hypothetical protein
VAFGITFATNAGVKKAPGRDERRRHDQRVTLDRRKHDDDLAERMAGGVRAIFVRRRRPGAHRTKLTPAE